MQTTTVTPSFVDANTIQLRFELGHIIDAVQTTTIPEGGNVDPDSGWIWNDGWVGRVQLSGDAYMPLDTYQSSPIEDLFDAPVPESGTRAAAIDNAALWTITVNGAPVALEDISRKSHILDSATVGWGVYDFRTLQNVFLDLDAPLTAGDVIEISFADPDFASITVTYAPREVISEAIHVNLTGYDPDDISKTAFLSSWNGWSVAEQAGQPQTYEGPLTYQVINEDTGTVAATGQTTLGAGINQTTDFELNFALTDVWEIDFSDVTTEGDYYIVVEGVGRSQTFSISDEVWSDVFETSFSGFYHQRSGIALESEYTDWVRGRSLHPEDGNVIVYATTLPITDTDESYGDGKPDQFGPLVAAATSEVLPDAWGGWHDAGDWDRRTQHIEASRKLMDLVEMAPDWAESFDAQIPENTNGIPDILDEAIWNMDFFARLQTADGGVRGGIEGDDYRGYGANSAEEEHILYAYAPDTWTTWEFAAAAAKLSRLLEKYDADAAAVWLERAERAMDWAEARVPADIDITQQTSRNLAAAELYATTEDPDWHNLFLQTSSYADPNRELAWNEWQYEAAITYSRLDPALTKADVAARAFEGVQGQADFLIDQGMQSGFGAIIDPYAPYGWGITASQPFNAATFMVAMHHLTGEDVYLDAILSDVQYGLGANPSNMVYMTGVEGVRSPEITLNADADSLHGGTPPPGITIYGDYGTHDYGVHPGQGAVWNTIFPDPYQTPVHESHNGYYLFVPSTEYTVQQGIADMTLVTGYLASLGEAEAPKGKLEAGKATVHQTSRDKWTQVTFDEPIEDAVVVAGPVTLRGGQSLTVNVRNVTDSGFELQVAEWEFLDGFHVPEIISWVAGTAGNHTLDDGTQISLGSTAPGVTGSVNLTGFDETPLVFGQVNGSNLPPMADRLHSVSADGFDFTLQAEEANSGSEVAANLSWIAVENTGQSSSGIFSANHQFADTSVTSDLAFLADMQTLNGGDTAGLRIRIGPDDLIDLKILEERSRDQELWHLNEDIAFWSLQTGTYDLY